MLFVGVVTLAGSYEMFGMFMKKAATLAVGQAFALYLDAVLVAVVAILGLIVLSDGLRQWYGYVILKKPFTSSEVIVMAAAVRRADARRQLLMVKRINVSGCRTVAGVGEPPGRHSCSRNAGR